MPGLLRRAAIAASVLFNAKAARAVGSAVSEWMIGQATYPPPGFGSLATHGYERNATVYAAIAMRADSLGQAPLRWYREGSLEDVKNPVELVLRRPNPVCTWKQLIALTDLYLILGGNCYWEKVFDGGGRLRQVWPLRPDRVQVIPGKTDLVGGYLYSIAGEEFPLERREILHFKEPHPLNDFYGMPKLAPALRSLCTDNEAVDFAKALFENFAMPGGIITVQKDTDFDNRERLKEQFIAKFGGSKRGAPAVFKAGMTFTPVSFDLQQVAFEQNRAMTITEILTVLKVSPILLGTKIGLEQSPYANYGEARRSFYEDTTEPRQDWIAEHISADPDFTPRGTLAYFDSSEVSALADLRISREGALRESWKAGLLRRDEARVRLNLAPVGGEEGTAFFVAPSPFGAPAGGAAEDPNADPAGAAPGSKSRKRGLRKAAVDLLGESLDSIAFAELWQGKMRRQAARTFKSQAEDVRRLVAASFKAPGVELAQVLNIMEQLAQLKSTWSVKAASDFEPMLVKLLEGAGSLASRGVDVRFDLDDSKIKSYLDTYRFRFAERISKSSAERVREVLLTGQDEGKTVEQVKADLEGEFKRWDSDRAELVARTETMRAGNGGVRLAYIASDVTKMRWLAASDPCPICAALDGKVVGVTEDFVADGGHLDYQDGDSSKSFTANYGALETPPCHPNCRCTIDAED